MGGRPATATLPDQSRAAWAGESFETDDIGLAEHLLSNAYTSMRISARGRRGSMRLSRTPIQFTGYEPLSPRAAAQWHATYAYVRDTVLADPDLASQPLIAASAARLLVATALTVFPNNTRTDPTIEDRRDAHPATIRRAIAFIEENAHRDIAVADIAAAAFVTVRAIQLAFRRHLDTTPMAHLRRVRLDHARHDLEQASADATTVTAVAYRWGFSSSSRFAAAYRRAYGVSPIHTLHH